MEFIEWKEVVVVCLSGHLSHCPCGVTTSSRRPWDTQTSHNNKNNSDTMFTPKRLKPCGVTQCCQHDPSSLTWDCFGWLCAEQRRLSGIGWRFTYSDWTLISWPGWFPWKLIARRPWGYIVSVCVFGDGPLWLELDYTLRINQWFTARWLYRYERAKSAKLCKCL